MTTLPAPRLESGSTAARERLDRARRGPRRTKLAEDLAERRHAPVMPKPKPVLTFRQELLGWMAKEKLSIRTTAKRLKVGPSSIQRWIKGANPHPHIKEAVLREMSR